MKRWWIWTAIVGIGVVVLGFVLIRDRPQAPFDFIPGRASVSKWQTQFGDRQVYYTFEGDFEEVASAAREELTASGYERLDAGRTRHDLHFMRLVVKSSSEVHVWSNTRFDGSRIMRDEGWITVLIEGPLLKPKPTLLDRLRSWLGL